MFVMLLAHSTKETHTTPAQHTKHTQHTKTSPRFSCGPEGMHRGLLQRYCEMSTLLLAPITPHTSDYVWSSLLKKQGSVLTAGACD